MKLGRIKHNNNLINNKVDYLSILYYSNSFDGSYSTIVKCLVVFWSINNSMPKQNLYEGLILISLWYWPEEFDTNRVLDRDWNEFNGRLVRVIAQSLSQCICRFWIAEYSSLTAGKRTANFEFFAVKLLSNSTDCNLTFTRCDVTWHVCAIFILPRSWLA